METKPETMKSPRSQFGEVGVWGYVALAFSFSWIAWILAIKLHSGEEYLNIGTACPAIAAIILSRNRQLSSSGSTVLRVIVFVVFLFLCWAVLFLHYSWRGSNDLRFDVNPWLLGPAVFPAWILSRALSRDGGVRSMLRRLIHPPTRWSIVALLLYPAIKLIPALMA